MDPLLEPGFFAKARIASASGALTRSASSSAVATSNLPGALANTSQGSSSPSDRQIASMTDADNPLDVGGDVGALILFTSPTLTGNQIDLAPDDGHEPHTRSAVLERNLAQGVSFAAVYPHLREGSYTIEGSDQRVTIVGGRVTTLDYHEDCCRIYYHPSTLSLLEEHIDP